MSEKTPILSKENQDADFAMWEDQFDLPSNESLPTGDAALEAARSRNESESTNERELPVESPAQAVEAQSNRVADMSDFTPYANLTNEQISASIDELFNNSRSIDTPATSPSVNEPATPESSRVANSANRTAEALASFAERYDKEGPKLLARKALRRIGRSLASPVRNSASALGEKISAAASAGKETLKTYVSPVEERVKLYETQPQAPEAEDTSDISEEEEIDERESYSKKSARALDWIGEKIEGNGGAAREFIADKLYDKAVRVDDREGTYASRTGDKVRSGINKLDQLSRENDGWLRDKIAEKYSDAKDRRNKRVKRQRFRTLGRKLVAYHQAGREASKNIKRNDHQDNFDLAG